jgi:predicted MFS family arabinose efflux permease
VAAGALQYGAGLPLFRPTQRIGRNARLIACAEGNGRMTRLSSPDGIAADQRTKIQLPPAASANAAEIGRGAEPELADGAHPSAVYSPTQRALMLFILFLVSTSAYLDRSMIGVAFEPIKHEFGASDSMLGILSGASFAILYVTLGLPVARWADRGDRKLIITGALAVWSVMTALCGIATSFWQLTLFRIGVGAGEAGAMAPAQSLLADYFPPHQRGKAIAVFMISVTAGNLIGIAGGAWVTQHFGWRAMFFAAGLFGLLLAPLAFWILREPRTSSAVLPVVEPFRTTIKALATKPSYVMTVAAMALFFGVAFGPMTFLVSFMNRIHGISIGEAGAIAGLCTAVGGLSGSIASGVLTDRLSNKDLRWLAWIPAAGLILTGGLLQAAVLVTPLSAMIALLFCGSFFVAAAYPPMYTLLHAVCGSARRVTALAAALFIANLVGLALGPLSVGVLSDLLATQIGSASGLRYALAIVAAALYPAGLLFAGAAAHVRTNLEP